MEKIKICVLLLSWSLYYVLCDFLIEAFDSPYIAGMAIRIGTVLLMTVYFIISKKFFQFFFTRDNLFIIIGVSFMTFLFDCIINIGLQYSTASSGSALLKTELLFVLLISAFQRKIVLKTFDYFLAIFITIGSILIICDDILHFSIDLYSLLFVLSALINSICAFIIQKLQQKYSVSSFQIAYSSNIVSLFMYSLVSLILLRKQQNISWNGNIWRTLIVCILCQILLVLIYYNILGLYQVWMIKTMLLVIPIITLGLQILIFHSYPRFSQIIGVFITIFSAMILVIRHYYFPADSN